MAIGHFFFEVPAFERFVLVLLAASVVILGEIFLRTTQRHQAELRTRDLEQELAHQKEKLGQQVAVVGQRFEKIFRLGPAPMVISRLSDGAFVDMNEMYLDYFGYTREEMVGRTSRELNIIGDEQRALLVAEIQAKGFARNVTIHTQTRNGEPRQALFSSEVLEFSSEPHMLSILFDVTELKETEKRLRLREADLAEAQSIARLGGWTIDLATNSGYWGVSFARLHGHPDDWHGCSLAEYFLMVPEEDRKAVEDSIRTGAVSGKSITFDHRIILPNNEMRWLNVRMHAVKDKSGKTIKLRGVSQDVSDRVRLEAHLRQSQKLDAVGQLASGIAHDMNNILGIMFGHLDMAEEDLPADHPVQNNLSAIRRASQRGKDLVRRILSTSSPRPAEGTMVEPVALIEETIGLLRATLPAMITIRSELQSGIPGIHADGTQLHQVVMNLATNAAHAMEDQQSGTLTISLAAVDVDDAMVALSPDLRVGSYVRISISDTGHGMDRKTQERIFEPFFTTKPARKGTGLGLAIVHGIVRSHGGALTVYSEQGRGTTFRIYLPAIELKEEQARLQAGVNLTPGNGEHVLCVDDEPELLEVTVGLLSRMGFKTTGQTDPVAALTALERNASGFRIILTDQSMPGMTGLRLARHARALHSDIDVILTSGTFTEAEIREAEQMGIFRIGKPATSEELARLMGGILQSR